VLAATGISVSALASAARNAGIPVRQGVNGHAHPLADPGGPGVSQRAVWDAFARPGASSASAGSSRSPGSPVPLENRIRTVT